MVEGGYGATVGKTASENQEMFLCLEHSRLIWIRSANSHTGPQQAMLHLEAGQMAASDQCAIMPELLLAFAGASTEEHLGQIAA